MDNSNEMAVPNSSEDEFLFSPPPAPNEEKPDVPFSALEEEIHRDQGSKWKNFFYHHRFILLAFGIPLAILLLILLIHQIFPFGSKTILRIDLYHQYAPFYQELYERLSNGQSLLYTFFSGLGTNFLGNFFNYLSNPFSLLILLFGEKYITEAIMLMVVLKCALSSASFCYYLKSSQKRQGYLAVAFSVLYAFCAYFVAYYWNIMWMDCMYLFPLIILGIERIVKEGKWKLYLFSLAAMMIFNYYIAFMICLFSIFYFFAYYFISRPDRKTGFRHFCASLWKYGSSSVFAALLAAFALFPMLAALTTSSATSGSFPQQLKVYFNVYEFFANLLPGIEPTIRSSADLVAPNIYCGAIVVLLIPLYIFSVKINLREKLIHLFLLFFMLFSFDINFLNYIWHAFHFPNDLPYRQSFIFSFLLLIMCYKVLVNIREYKIRHILLSGAACLVFVGCVAYFGQDNANIGTLIFSVVAIVMFTYAVSLLVTKRYRSQLVSVLCLLLVVIEATVQTACYWQSNQPKDSYYANYEEIRGIVDTLKTQDTGFYRVEKDQSKTRNDPSLYQYNGVSTFSSLANEGTSKALRKLGLFGNNINSYTYSPATPLINALVSLKYVMSETPLTDQKMYTELFQTEHYTVYENNYYLPVLFELSGDFHDLELASPNAFKNQTNLFYAMTKENSANEIFVSRIPDEIKMEDGSLDNPNTTGGIYYYRQKSGNEPKVTATILPQQTEHLFLYLTSSYVENITVTKQGVTKQHEVKRPNILDLGMCEKGEKIEIQFSVTSEDGGSFSLYVNALDYKAYEKVYQQLSGGKVNIISHSDTKITAEVEAEQAGVYFVSIPYEKAWKVFVDGQEVETSSVVTAFLSFRTGPGIHRVELVYHPQSLYWGGILSIGAFSLLSIFLIVQASWKRHRSRQRIQLKEAHSNNENYR